MNNEDRGPETLENRVSGSSSPRWTIPLGAAALAGFTAANVIDIAQFDPVNFSYMKDLGGMAAITGITAGAGLMGYVAQDTIRKAGSWFGSTLLGRIGKNVLGIRDLVTDHEDGTQTKITQGKGTAKLRVGGCLTIAACLVGLTYGIAEKKLVDPSFSEPVAKPIQEFYKKNWDINWSGRRNVHFLRNYVFGDPLDGIEKPPSTLSSGKELKAWNYKHFGNLGKDPGVTGTWRLTHSFIDKDIPLEGGRFVHTFYYLETYKPIGRIMMLDGKSIALAQYDIIMNPLNPFDKRNFDDVIWDCGHKLHKAGSKLYVSTILPLEGPEREIIITELGSDKPLFGTPVVAVPANSPHLALFKSTSEGAQLRYGILKDGKLDALLVDESGKSEPSNEQLNHRYYGGFKIKQDNGK